MKDEEALKAAGTECFEQMKILNPKGGIREYINMAVNFGANWQEKRMYTPEETIAFASWILKRNIEELATPSMLTSIRTNSDEALLKEWHEEFKGK